jgi:bacterioferritin-associated ferredoxin
MYVCICNGVTDREIRSAVEQGATTLECLRDQLGVASCCGTCACAAEELLPSGGASTVSEARRRRSELVRTDPAPSASPVST